MADEHAPPALDQSEIAKLEVQAAMYKAQSATAVERLDGNLSDLFKHLENMAAHIVAFEAVLKCLVKEHPIAWEPVESDIRSRIESGTGSQGNPDIALGVASRIVNS